MLALEPKLPIKRKFATGNLVAVCKGVFAGRMGVIIDPDLPTGSRGSPFPRPQPGYYRVKLRLNGQEFTAHLREDEIVFASE